MTTNKYLSRDVRHQSMECVDGSGGRRKAYIDKGAFQDQVISLR
jgi:hypothetical protein